MLLPEPMLKCHAHTRSGLQCAHYPMHGQRVCHMHGGKTPAAMAKAEERLRALEHPAISTLGHIIRNGDTDAVKLAAARYLLELLGHKASVQVQTEAEVTVRVIHEDQPIVVLEQRYRDTGNGNDRANDTAG